MVWNTGRDRRSMSIPLSLILFSASQIPRGILNPIFRTTLHSAITDPETRATTASCATMARYAGGALGLLLSDYQRNTQVSRLPGSGLGCHHYRCVVAV